MARFVNQAAIMLVRDGTILPVPYKLFPGAIVPHNILGFWELRRQRDIGQMKIQGPDLGVNVPAFPSKNRRHGALGLQGALVQRRKH
jgi:hypothetical protein